MTGQSTGSITPAEGAASAGVDPPAEQTRLLRQGRPLKRWRYVAFFCEELMGCAAAVQVGPARHTFWALLDRSTGELRARTRILPRRREIGLAPGTMAIADRGVQLALELDEEPGVQALCPHGRAAVWTRKQAGIPARGTLQIDGGAVRGVHARAVVDDTAGHHARVTEWRWSAGVGEGADDTPLAWNLVSGINDPPSGSERAVWIDGVPSEAPPVRFAADLSQIECADGSLLHFVPEAERRRSERWLVASSDYRAPFGTFAGMLPGGVELAGGLGVMEWHRARW